MALPPQNAKMQYLPHIIFKEAISNIEKVAMRTGTVKELYEVGRSKFTRKGIWVCRDEFFSHTGKETFPLCDLEGAQATGREEKNLRACLSQSTQRTQRKMIGILP